MTYTERLEQIIRRTQFVLRQAAEREAALVKAREEA